MDTFAVHSKSVLSRKLHEAFLFREKSLLKMLNVILPFIRQCGERQRRKVFFDISKGARISQFFSNTVRQMQLLVDEWLLH